MPELHWKQELKVYNKELAYTGASLFVDKDEIYILWDDGTQDYYAGGLSEDELLDWIAHAKFDVERMFLHRGERLIRCTVKSPQLILNQHTAYFGSERAALWWVNDNLGHTDTREGQEPLTLKSIGDAPKVNAMLRKYFNDPDNKQYGVSVEDITEEVIEACAEKFCEFRWPCSLLLKVANHLAVELEKIEK